MDLKIKDVAELLQISETTVRRWLADGKIPAYRLNRQYRFNRYEIEDWLMQQKLSASPVEKILATGEDETHKLPPMGWGGKPTHLQFSLYRALYRGDVLTEIDGSSKEAVIRSAMIQIAARFHLDAAVLSELFLDRERMMPTSFGHGVGVPHTRDFLLGTHYDVITVVYLEKPIEYGALDGEPVHTLFFLFACEDRHHLNLLSKLAHLHSSADNRSFLRGCPNRNILLDFVRNWEQTLST